MSKIDILPDLNVENSETNSTVENGVDEFIKYLQNLRIKTSGNLLIGHLNINSIRNKVNMLSYMIVNKIDILMISESKLDDTFPTSQFVIDSFTEPFRLDRTRNGGGILLYVKNNITATLLTSYTLPEDIEALFVEIVIGNFKWLFCCSYNPHKSMITYHLQEIGKGLEFYTSNYEKILLMGDFNSEMSETSMNSFCNLYNLKCLVQEPTCYKNPERPSCIDLFLSNCENHFLKTEILETGLSDFHKLIITATMLKFEKQPPQIVTYRNYKNYNKELFEKDIQIKLSEFDIENIPYETFTNIFIDILNLHAPLKKKYLRANHSKFISKELSKEIMLRSKLRNKFLKDKTDEARTKYRKQRNICVHLLRRAKRNYYNDLDLSNVTDNRKFWKTIRPLFANKINVKNKIALNEDSISTNNDSSSIKISYNKSFSQNRDIKRTNNFGVESISTLGAKIWALVPENLKQSTSINIFKRGIKRWNPSNCPCRLCRVYVQNVGFI